jgi:histidinol-phosphate aminotransferase
LLKNNPRSVVVVDEAYIDFGGTSAISLVAQFPNLLVVQTLSKSRSLAGLRVGLAVGHPDLIEALNRVKNSFNSYPLDRLAVAGAIAAFEDQDYFKLTCDAVINTRQKLTARLQELDLKSCLRRRILCLRVTLNMMRQHWRKTCAHGISSCAISVCHG